MINILLYNSNNEVRRFPAEDNGTPQGNFSQRVLDNLAEAYARGDYEIVPVPEPVPETDWISFNTAMLSDSNWQAWALPADLRNAMIAASINSNLVSLENAYAIAKAAVPPSAEAIEEWQTLADTYNVPIVF